MVALCNNITLEDLWNYTTNLFAPETIYNFSVLLILNTTPNFSVLCLSYKKKLKETYLCNAK